MILPENTMVDVDVLKAQLVRGDTNQSWGFRVHGGVDLNLPLTVVKILGGGPAAKIGLQPGDEIVEIDDTSTSALTQEQAQNLIDSHTNTLLMTVERRVTGSTSDMPPGTVINIAPPGTQQQQQQQPPAVKNYQTLDMTGSSRPRSHVNHTQVLPLFDDYQTVQARPFESHRQRTSAVYFEPQQQQQQPPAARPVNYQSNYAHYEPENYANDSHSSTSRHYSPAADAHTYCPQSRTFKMLQSVMHNEEPAAGVSGLPPPRSATMEHIKHQQQYHGASGSGGGQRVKVFMPQQYNSPMGMYSAHNVLETFTAQAGSMLDNLERRQVQNSGEEQAPVYSSF